METFVLAALAVALVVVVPAIENSPITNNSEPPLLSAAGQAAEEATPQGEST